MAEQQQQFAAWAVVELMGRQQIAGYVTEQQIAGTPMLRVDVPATGNSQPFTKFLGASAIYGITPTTEAIATSQAQYLDVRPIQTWMGGKITISMHGLEIGTSQRSGWSLMGVPDDGDGGEDSQEEDGGEGDEEEVEDDIPL